MGLYKPSTVSSLSYTVSNFSYWFEIVSPCFVISNNIGKLCSTELTELGKHF